MVSHSNYQEGGRGLILILYLQDEGGRHPPSQVSQVGVEGGESVIVLHRGVISSTILGLLLLLTLKDCLRTLLMITLRKMSIMGRCLLLMIWKFFLKTLLV